jgi:hypothetical protein
MSIFELPELKAYEHFKAFNDALYRLKLKDVDPVEVDMLLATFPEHLKGQALLHAYDRSVHFTSANILKYVQAKGIERMYPDLYDNLEVAQRLRRRLLDTKLNKMSSLGHIYILHRAAAYYGKDFTLDSVDTIFNTYDAGEKGVTPDPGSHAKLNDAATCLIRLRIFCAQDTLDDLEVGNQVAYRFTEVLGSFGVSKLPEFDLLRVISEFNFDDAGTLTTLLRNGFHPGLAPIYPHLDSAIKTAVSQPFKQQSLDFITAALKVRPATVLNELMALPDESFFKQVRGRFMDKYLSSNRMLPKADAGHDYNDPSYLALVDSFNARILSDRFVVKYIANHQGIASPSCEDMVTLMLSTRLKSQGVDLKIDKRFPQERFAKLVGFAGDYPLLASYRDCGLALLKAGVQDALVALYHEIYETQGSARTMKNPDTVSDQFKANHMAARLTCELSIHKPEWTQAKQRKITPILQTTTPDLSSRNLSAQGTLRVITSSLSEDELLEAVGKRPELLRYLINEEVLGKEHLAKLPLPMLGQEFSKDLGL